MKFYNERAEVLIPVFMGIMCSFVLCALIASHSFAFFKIEIPETIEIVEIVEESEPEEIDVNFLLTTANDIQTPILEYYRNEEYAEWVINFFTGICSNREIAKAILDNSNEYKVPAALAFALSWEESRFNPNAVNRNNRNGSIDCGLFQLNNRSFPNLETNDFFNIGINARYGISHLRFCLNFGGSEISALAMYNAGTAKVSNTGAPKVTLDYISRILENRSRIEGRFHVMLIKEEESRLAEKDQDIPVTVQQPYYNRTLVSASPL